MKTTIMIRTTAGSAEVHAKIVAPGLAVHQERGNEISPTWAITHIGSGLQIATGARTEAQALSAALALGKLTDWTVTDEVLIARMKGRRREVTDILDPRAMRLSTVDAPPEAYP